MGVLSLGLPGLAKAQCSPAGLNSGPLLASTNGVNFSVNYTSNTNSADYFPPSRAVWFRDALTEMHERISNVLDAGDPYSNLLPRYVGYVYDRSDSWASAFANCFVMEADVFGPMGGDAQTPLRKVTGHEMYHTVQRGYLCQISNSCQNDGTSIGGSFARWVSEGQARFHDDRYHPDFDTATFPTSFESSVGDTLSAPQESVFDKSYDAALFWNYLAEQAGQVTDEPQVGVDLVRAWWEQMVSDSVSGSVASFDTLETILAGRGQPLRELFHDYTICNLTRELDLSEMTPVQQVRYRYLDEQPGNGAAYSGAIARQVFASMASANGATSVVDFAADYYEVPVQFNNECKIVGLQVQADDLAGFSLIGAGNNDKVLSFSKQVGRDPARAFLVSSNNPITRLYGVVSGVDGDINYSFAFGEGDVEVDILRPTMARPAYPGEGTNTSRLLVRVGVSGPAELLPAGNTNLSVKGLSADEFTVSVDGMAADVLAADYVGGEYWLSVNPPALAAGMYDLGVLLCGKQIISYDSVVYGDEQLNHVVVVDQSGSMNGEKMDAAKQAAMLYIDAVSDGDGLAVVGFFGNNTECDDDAVMVGPNQMLSASDATRTQFKAGVNNMGASGQTSIGDGLVKAAQAFSGFSDSAAAVTNEWIVLLSDGVENEELLWSQENASCGLPPLRDTFPTNGIQINAIALGPEADQALLQDMGDQTEGDHTYIDTTDPAASALGASSPAGSSALPSSPLGLRLAEAYLRMYEKASGMERVHQGVVTIVDEKQSFTIDVPDDDTQRGLFYFVWSHPGMAQDIILTTPSGDKIKANGGIILERTNVLHRVFEVNAPLPSGAYPVQVQSDAGGQLLYGFLADTYKDLQIDLSFTQVPQGHGQGASQPLGEFEQGVPVQVRATVTDRLGPVRDASLLVTVILPDGSVSCGPVELFDDGSHSDLERGDGIYGAEITTTHLAMSRTLPDIDLEKFAPTNTPAGTYRVFVEASGKANTGDEFQRETEGAFTVVEASDEWSERDGDGDGLPDTWERFYNTHPNLDDATKDPDDDGLTNRDEFLHGTDPLDADTDNGGEADGSEVRNGRCPILASDDALPAPRGVGVLADPGCESASIMVPFANVLVIPDHPAYEVVDVWASSRPEGPFTLVQSVDTSNDLVLSTTHEELDAGSPVFYRLRARGANGLQTAWSRTFHGTPYADPVPPRGVITINHYAPTTAVREVWVDVSSTGNATHVRLGNAPIQGDEPLLEITGSRIAHTLPPSASPVTASVHAVFYTAEGLAGHPTRAQIVLDPSRPFDPSLDSDGDGLFDVDERDETRTDPYHADTDRDGVSDREELENNLNPFSEDTDGDGLSDIEELLGGSNPLRRDSGGDGVDDRWKVDYGFDPGVPLNPKGDADNDGLSDYSEWLTGTHPLDPSSRFGASPVVQSGNSLAIRFPTLRGRTYALQTTHDLAKPEWITQATLVGEEREGTFNLGQTNANGFVYYRLQLVDSPAP